MVNIEKILDLYREDTTVRRGEGCVFILLPFFHTKSDDGITIKVSEDEDGLPVLSDCHTTVDYLELRDVELSDYSDRLKKIIRRFGLTLDGNVIRATVPSLDENYVEIYLGYFIQALSIIANIDI